MSFENQRQQFTREHLWFCEVEVNGQTFRFCENRAPLPRGLIAQPTMTRQSITPARVDLTGGIGVRASASVNFSDHLDYTVYGSANNPVLFWVNWRARNIGYQGGRLTIFSGYIVDDNFDLGNFQRRDYVIESFSLSEGQASISARDALKLASGDRAKAPRKSQGLLSNELAIDTTSITLTPAGIGDIEYPLAIQANPDSYFFIRVGDEVMECTNRADDVLTVTRGQYNTLAADHSLNDVAQLCLYYNDTLANINFDLLTTYANVPTEQIPLAEWQQETNLFLAGLFEALITEPVNVDALLKETGESAPHYMYWDERTNLINLVAIKPPPNTAQCFNSEQHILNRSTRVVDQPDMRISTVVVRFGQFDPTMELDEQSNYRQAHVRITPNSIARYNGVEKYKFINSRWINNSNRAAAVRLAARYGRRYEDIPRLVNFNLDASDADIWTGSPITIDSNLILNEQGERFCMPAQVISAGESGDYQYQALEHSYGQAFDSDLETDDPNQRLVVLSGVLTNINLREIYNTLFPDVRDEYNIVFVFDTACCIGSTSNQTYSIETGFWNELVESSVTLDIRGIVVGKGGEGSSTETLSPLPASDGGPAINVNVNLIILVSGTLGGGGGGGGASIGFIDSNVRAAGGGGAGFQIGRSGTGSSSSSEGVSAFLRPPQDGTKINFGDGATSSVRGLLGGIEQDFAEAGRGGGLGEDGILGVSSLAGSAGKTVNLNGKTVVIEDDSNVFGEVS
jgi:hypothetical protein